MLLVAAIGLFFFLRRRRRASKEPHSQVAYDKHTSHTDTAELDGLRGGHELDGDSNTGGRDYSDQNDEGGKIVYGGPNPPLGAEHQSRQHQELYEMESTGGDGRNNLRHSQAFELDGSSPSLP